MLCELQGVKKEAVPAQEEAAGALGSLARGNALNQEAICVAGGITRLLALMTSATPAVRVSTIRTFGRC